MTGSGLIEPNVAPLLVPTRPRSKAKLIREKRSLSFSRAAFSANRVPPSEGSLRSIGA
jgi:hypothetical protein